MHDDIPPDPTGAPGAGLFSRLTQGLREHFGSGAAAQAERPPPLDPRLAPWAAKVKSAADAVELDAGEVSVEALAAEEDDTDGDADGDADFDATAMERL